METELPPREMLPIDFVQEAKLIRDRIRQAIIDELNRSGPGSEDLMGLLAADAKATEIYRMAVHQLEAR